MGSVSGSHEQIGICRILRALPWSCMALVICLQVNTAHAASPCDRIIDSSDYLGACIDYLHRDALLAIQARVTGTEYSKVSIADFCAYVDKHRDNDMLVQTSKGICDPGSFRTLSRPE